MKKNSFFHKLNFVFNSLMAVLLLIAYVIPYIDPEKQSSIAVLSLLFPILLTINIIFCIYWLINLKKQFLLSTIIIALGYSHFNAFFEFEGKEIFLNDDIKIMSYNVRRFNEYKQINSPTIKKDILKFITKHNPDIICFQEHPSKKKILDNYAFFYHSIYVNDGLAIYSKFPIINSYDFEFNKTNNDCVYVDLKIDGDTIRIYNAHLQSYVINPNKKNFGEKSKHYLFNKFKTVFYKQSKQVKLIKNSLKECNYKSIIIGDFNNTAYSWTYNQLTQNRKDAFVEAGKGFGKSYNAIIPLRIDFILPDNSIAVNHFNTFDVKYSDHFPIMARLNLNTK